jgi:hypothetical protein
VTKYEVTENVFFCWNNFKAHFENKFFWAFAGPFKNRPNVCLHYKFVSKNKDKFQCRGLDLDLSNPILINGLGFKRKIVDLQNIDILLGCIMPEQSIRNSMCNGA